MEHMSTKKVKRISGKTLLVTVDMSKGKHTGYCRCPDGTERKPFDFLNNSKGFEEFWQRVCEMKRVHDLEEMVIGFESTGPYAEPLLHYEKERGKTCTGNPFSHEEAERASRQLSGQDGL